MSRQPDKKVTVSIDPELLLLVDSYVEQHPRTSRSAVFEDALKNWYRQQLEQADIEYYSSLTANEKASDKSWSEITTVAAKHIWKN